uniref:Protein kinase domain-containing protein n=1 Tax=Fagus sylvatica TaxID=28930 RepID=A0A2N9IMA2_FAGSY
MGSSLSCCDCSDKVDEGVIAGGNTTWRMFTYKELHVATNGFSEDNKLGEGGFGSVFWGKTFDGLQIAVKKLKAMNSKAEMEFAVEVEVLGRVRHKNLLGLRGYCVGTDQMLIVYDYMPNLSLLSHLHGQFGVEAQLDWKKRINIAIGSAEGLLSITMASANSSLNIPSNQSPLLLLNNMSNLMSTKLDSSNFMIWKLQIIAVLDAYSMLDHLDGSIPKPNQFLTTETGIQAVNPEFLVWSKKDKALLSLLYSICSSSVLAMVVGKSSSQEVWNTLEERFTSTVRSSVLNLKLELQSIKKTSNESVSSYLQRIKTVRDKLSAIGVHSDQEELTHVILKGLPKEYAPFASTIRTRDTVLSLERLTYQQQQQNSSTTQSPQATFQGKNERPTCQICWKMGHYAIDYYNRMNFAYQGKNPTTKLAAMASASNLHYTQNVETWLTDTGAIDHITANANNLSPQAPYQGQEQVLVGNGQNLPIQNIGFTYRETSLQGPE